MIHFCSHGLSSTWRMPRIELNGEGEPVWLTPYLRDQQPEGKRDAISYWWSSGTKLLSLTVSEIFNVECHAMVDMTLIRPLNESQGH